MGRQVTLLLLCLVPSLADRVCAQTPAAAPAFVVAKSPSDCEAQAWAALNDSVTDAKNRDTRVMALAALGILREDAKAIQLIRASMADAETEVRLAAVLAAGEAKNPALLEPLHGLIADADPGVAFAAARVLAKAGDVAGENVLVAVSRGTHVATPGMMSTAKSVFNAGLKHTGELVKAGAVQVRELMLSPFGMGSFATESLKKMGGDGMRVAAVQSLADYHSPQVRDELMTLLADRDPGVRAVSAKGLAAYREPLVRSALSHLLDDTKLPVKLTASAAYIAASQVDATSAGPAAKVSRGLRSKKP